MDEMEQKERDKGEKGRGGRITGADYAEMRFKHLGLLGVFNGFLINAAVCQKPTTLWQSHSNLTLFSLAGMSFTACLWVMEVRSTLWGVSERIPTNPSASPQDAKPRSEPEEANKTTQIPWHSPGVAHWTLINATNASIALYILSYLFWWFMWTAPGEMTCAGFVGWIASAAAGVFLLLYTAREYWQIWKKAKSEWKW